jgi:hypothetical protein
MASNSEVLSEDVSHKLNVLIESEAVLLRPGSIA